MLMLGDLGSLGNKSLTLLLHRLLQANFTSWTNDSLTICLLGGLDAMMFLVGVTSSKVAFAEKLVQHVAAQEREFCKLAHDVGSACCACDGTLAGVSVAGERQGS